MKHQSSGLKHTVSLSLLAASLNPACHNFVNSNFFPKFFYDFHEIKQVRFIVHLDDFYTETISAVSYNMIITIIPYWPVWTFTEIVGNWKYGDS